jgi:hypothetical protein
VAAAVALPWMGVLWLTALPLRLLEALALDRLIELGAGAERYGRYLGELSLAIGLATLLACYGRAVYARACGERYTSGRTPGWRLLAPPPGPLVSYLYVALVLEVVLLATALSVVAVPVVVTLGGLAAASHPFFERPGLFAPFRALFESCRGVKALVGSAGIFALAFLIAVLNLFFLILLAVELADGVFGGSLAPWRAALGPGNRTLWLLLCAAAWMLVEPFWLAVLSVHVRRLRGRSRGEDLRRAWAALQAAGQV